MRLNGFRCDGCGKEHLLEPYQEVRMYAQGMPDDWYLVSRGDNYEKRQEPILFCSALCLHRWTGQSLSADPEPESPYIRREEGV